MGPCWPCWGESGMLHLRPPARPAVGVQTSPTLPSVNESPSSLSSKR